MDAGVRHPTRSERVLAGWQAGMASVLAMLVWLGLTAWAVGRSFWTAENIAGSAIYGDAALRARFTWATLAGTAIYLLVYSLVGAFFGMCAPVRASRLRLTLLGLLVGVCWYYLAFRVLWTRIDPLVPLYTHDGPMLAGHLLYGSLLGRLRRYLPPVPAMQAPEIHVAVLDAAPAADCETPRTDGI
jgi:hypothetical protein